MNIDNRLRALELIHRVQCGDRKFNGTAAVTVEIGGVSDSGMVQYDVLRIHNAPAAVVDALRDAGFSLAVRDGALVVDDYALMDAEADDDRSLSDLFSADAEEDADDADSEAAA